jgi:glutathione S-transferase
MKLYGCANSRSLRALWALEHAGASYEYSHVDLFRGEGASAAFRALNPAGKVPVLVDGDLTLTESAAIVAYIGERHPESGLVPDDIAGRADYWRWSSFIITELEQPLWTIAKHRFILPKARRVPAIEATAVWEFGQAAALLAAALQDRKYILKQTLTGSDILAVHTLAWARSARVPLGDSTLDAYLDRLGGGPALLRAREVEKQ